MILTQYISFEKEAFQILKYVYLTLFWLSLWKIKQGIYFLFIRSHDSFKPRASVCFGKAQSKEWKSHRQRALSVKGLLNEYDNDISLKQIYQLNKVINLMLILYSNNENLYNEKQFKIIFAYQSYCRWTDSWRGKGALLLFPFLCTTTATI